MGRPTKQGIEYFPLDTSFDQKIQMLILEKGPLALAVIITIWQIIYEDEGYFVPYSNDLLLFLKQRIVVDISQSDDIIKSALKRNIFNEPMFLRYNILTSKAIQKRYFIAAKRKKEINVCKNYLCEGVNVCKNTIYSGVNVSKNATKEKEKEKEKEDVKEEEHKKTKKTFSYPVWLDLKLWQEFKNHRVKIKHPMTLYSEKLAIGKLQKIMADGFTQEEILNNAIEKGWRGIFPPAKDNNKKGAANGKQSWKYDDREQDTSQIREYERTAEEVFS